MEKEIAKSVGPCSLSKGHNMQHSGHTGQKFAK